MSWATPYILQLREQGWAEFRPRGHSMEPRVRDNELVRVEAITDDTALKWNDVVLCTVNGRQYLHLIKAINGERYLIGNNRGGLNGWTNRAHIHGVLVPSN